MVRRRQKQTGEQVSTATEAANPLPRLQPYVRCTCGTCRECRSNAHCDRVFAKLVDFARGVTQLEIKEYRVQKGSVRSPIADV